MSHSRDIIWWKLFWCHESCFSWLFLKSLWTGFLDGTQCPLRDDECKSLLVDQHWRIYVIEKSRLSVRHSFFSSAEHILLVLHKLFVRWGVSGRTAAVLLHSTSRINSKQHTASFCSSYLTFSPNTSLKSSRCSHTIVTIRTKDYY